MKEYTSFLPRFTPDEAKETAALPFLTEAEKGELSIVKGWLLEANTYKLVQMFYGDTVLHYTPPERGLHITQSAFEINFYEFSDRYQALLRKGKVLKSEAVSLNAQEDTVSHQARSPRMGRSN